MIHFEGTPQEAAEIIRNEWSRFDCARWTVRQEEGWDYGWTVNKFYEIDWTDNPKRSGACRTAHIADWEEPEFTEAQLIERVINCLPPVGLVTVILEPNTK
jgi:hypothetical protein